MRPGDMFLAIILIFFGIMINNPDILSVESLIKGGIVLVIFLIVAIFFIRDHLPMMKLRKAEAEYAEDDDEEKLLEAISEFKATNKLLSDNYKAHLMEAQLHLYKAEFTNALDDLLYCDKRDMDDSAKLHLLVLRARILTFMGMIGSHRDIFTQIKEARGTMSSSDCFAMTLCRGYLNIQDEKYDEAEKKVTKLQAMLAEFIIKPLQFQNEIRWLESLLEIARNRDQLTYERQLNLLTGMKCKPYLIQNFTKTKETMMS